MLDNLFAVMKFEKGRNQASVDVESRDLAIAELAIWFSGNRFDLMPRRVVLVNRLRIFEDEHPNPPFSAGFIRGTFGRHQLRALEPLTVFTDEASHVRVDCVHAPAELVVSPIEDVIHHSLAGHDDLMSGEKMLQLL